MASNRYINTSLWSDTYIRTLKTNEKLIWIYLLTNPATNIAGIYEINLDQVALDTKIGGKTVEKVFIKLQHDGKIFYKDGWIVIKNWTKHQKINPSVRLGINRVINDIPKWLKIKIGIEVDDAQMMLGSIQAPDSLWTGSDILNLTKLNYNANDAESGINPANGHKNYKEKSNNTNRRNYKRHDMEDFGTLSRRQLRERGL